MHAHPGAAVRMSLRGAAPALALTLAAAVLLGPASSQAAARIHAGKPKPGAAPFISFVPLSGPGVPALAFVHYTIAAAAHTASRPVDVRYSLAYLQRRGYVDLDAQKVTLPVFGLYAGATNAVAVELDYADGSSDQLPVQIATAKWKDPNKIYDHGMVVQARKPGSALGFDFFYVKSELGSPVVIDSDGRVRWAVPGLPGTYASTFSANGFVEGLETSLQIWRAELDGTVTQPATLASADGIDFSHSVDPGKTGLVGELDVVVDGQTQLRSTAMEFDPVTGAEAHEWNFVQILSDTMRAGGDDPSLFVRPDVDWFHMNMVFYDAGDDSLIVSSRENFLMKVDYATGAIRWIFGDPTKYWYSFASLRALSLTLDADGLAPLGQHSTTIAPDGHLLLFNNGTPSFHEPPGEPAGARRKWSVVAAYTLDEAAQAVHPAWSFDYGQSLLSPLCSSARQLPDGSVLVDYAMTHHQTRAHVVGLNPARHVVFDYWYANHEACDTAWNAQPIAFDALAFD